MFIAGVNETSERPRFAGVNRGGIAKPTIAGESEPVIRAETGPQDVEFC